MPLSAGTRLGPYEILGAIGAGGMGEVYRARDTGLHRDVAVKILPAAFSSEPDRVARFEREARLLAALNHPHIGAIYGLAESADVKGLVLELVEGPTLADEIARGPLPLTQALEIAAQIADALDAAHERGVIHRDLKPANVKVTPAGIVKVLDFGLAKALGPDATATTDVSHSPTLTATATRGGVILGTAAYMSPEQARGLAVDRRSDLWAFGCVLFEMITGRAAFRGDTVTDIIAAIIEREPDWNALPAQTPARVRRLLERCLMKDVRRRVRDAGDVRIELEDTGSAPMLTAGASTVAVRRPWTWMIAAGVFALAALASALGWWRASRAETLIQPVTQLDVDLGTETALGTSIGSDVVLSPDGRRLVFVSGGRLFGRRLDQERPSELSGTTGAFSPFFSPDGQWVGFFTPSALNKISIDGGSVIPICEARGGRGASWGEDGVIVAALGALEGLSRVSSTGGMPTTLIERASGEVTQRWPQILPGGKSALFTSNTLPFYFDGARIDVVSLVDRTRKTLVENATFGRYVERTDGTGLLTYVRRGTLFAAPFDRATLTLLGPAAPMPEEISYAPITGFARLSFSTTGTLAYRKRSQNTLQWLEATRSPHALFPSLGDYEAPSLSADGERLAVNAAGDLVVYDWRRDATTRIATDSEAGMSAWSPDGRYLVFQGPGGMWWARSDAASSPQLLTKSRHAQIPGGFTDDGSRLVFQELNPDNNQLWNVSTVSVSATAAGLSAGQPEAFLATASDERNPRFSPDGRWIAYNANDSGRLEIYVRAFPDRGEKWQVSTNGGQQPEWSRTGRRLFFRDGGERLMMATYTIGDSRFVTDRPRVWSERPLADQTLNYSVAPDGERIAAVMPVEGPERQRDRTQVTLFFNAVDEFRRRLSAR